MPNLPDKVTVFISDALYKMMHRMLLSVARHCWMLEVDFEKPYTFTRNYLTANHCLGDPPPDRTLKFRLFDLDGILFFSGLMSQTLYHSHHASLPLDEAKIWG